MDNYGYSNNNEMNQGAADDLNPYRRIQQESKQKKGMFFVGLLAGVLLSTLMVGCVYVGVRFNDLWRIRVRLTSAGGAVAESIVKDDSLKKLEAIEDVIDKYYYKEEDIHTNEMIEGMYAGMVASLGDPYSVYYTAEEWQALMQDTEGIYYGIGAYVQ